MTGVNGVTAGNNVHANSGGLYNLYSGAGYAALGTAMLGVSIANVIFGKFENLPLDVLWTVGNYSLGLGQALHYLAGKS